MPASINFIPTPRHQHAPCSHDHPYLPKKKQIGFMDPEKPPTNKKITDIVRLRQRLQKWKKVAVAPKSNGMKSISFLKRTFSFSIASSSAFFSDIPKGYLAICVGEEMRRYVIPTEYLGHEGFQFLLKEAAEEFGFQQEGVLRIPCEVSVFESILKVVGKKNKVGFGYSCSAEAELPQPYHLQKPMCREL